MVTANFHHKIYRIYDILYHCLSLRHKIYINYEGNNDAYMIYDKGISIYHKI